LEVCFLRYAYLTPTAHKNVDVAVDVLKKYKCDDIIYDPSTSIDKNRPKLLDLFNRLRPGDTLILLRLDEVGLTTPHFLKFMQSLLDHRVRLICIVEKIDTKDLAMQNLVHSLNKMDRYLKLRLEKENTSTYAEANGIDIDKTSIAKLFLEASKFDTSQKYREETMTDQSDTESEEIEPEEDKKGNLSSSEARYLYKRSLLGGNSS
jgi:hypothetical protein